MAQFNGDLGWTAVAAESTYGTLGTSLVYQHAISSGLKPQYNRTVPPCLGSTDPHVGYRLSRWTAGTVTLGHTDEEDDIGVIYDHMASAVGNDYTFGGTPTNGSLSFFVDYGDVEWDYSGCVVRGITWNLSASDYSTIALDVLGQSVAKYAGGPRITAIPDCKEVTTPGDLSVFTMNSVDVSGAIKGATINWAWQTTDIGRQRFGSQLLPQPVRVGRQVITATFNLELDDATGADTLQVLEDFIAGDAQDIVLDNYEMIGCRLTGEMPDQGSGLVEMPMTVLAGSLVVTTT